MLIMEEACCDGLQTLWKSLKEIMKSTMKNALINKERCFNIRYLYRGVTSGEIKVKVNNEINLQTSQLHFAIKIENHTKQKIKILPKNKNRIRGKIKHEGPNKLMKKNLGDITQKKTINKFANYICNKRLLSFLSSPAAVTQIKTSNAHLCAVTSYPNIIS
jgi:uncharacterized protein YaaW (UPF0174 family)